MHPIARHGPSPQASNSWSLDPLFLIFAPYALPAALTAPWRDLAPVITVMHTAGIEEADTPARGTILLPAIVRSQIFLCVSALVAGSANLPSQLLRMSAAVWPALCSNVHCRKAFLA